MSSGTAQYQLPIQLGEHKPVDVLNMIMALCSHWLSQSGTTDQQVLMLSSSNSIL
jgi:hypothetical protein